MSTPNGKEIVGGVLEAFNNRRWEDIDRLYSPNYVNHNAPPGLAGDRDGQRQAMMQLVESFPDAHVTATHVVGENDLVVVRDILRGKHQGDFAGIAPTGKDAELQFIHLYRIAQGQIVERWGLVDASSVG